MRIEPATPPLSFSLASLRLVCVRTYTRNLPLRLYDGVKNYHRPVEVVLDDVGMRAFSIDHLEHLPHVVFTERSTSDSVAIGNVDSSDVLQL